MKSLVWAEQRHTRSMSRMEGSVFRSIKFFKFNSVIVIDIVVFISFKMWLFWQVSRGVSVESFWCELRSFWTSPRKFFSSTRRPHQSHPPPPPSSDGDVTALSDHGSVYPNINFLPVTVITFCWGWGVGGGGWGVGGGGWGVGGGWGGVVVVLYLQKCCLPHL